MYLHGNARILRKFELAQKQLVLEGFVGILVMVVKPYLAERNALGVREQGGYFF